MTEETKEQEANAVAGGQNERLVMCDTDYIDTAIVKLVNAGEDLPKEVELYDPYSGTWNQISSVALEAANRQSLYGDKAWLCTWEDIWPRMRLTT